MSKILWYEPGDTNVSIYVMLRDENTGQGLTGLVYNSAGASCYYTKERAAATALSLATLASAVAAHSDGGFVEVDSTNTPGLYRLDLSDTIVSAAGMVRVNVQFTGVLNYSIVLMVEYKPLTAAEVNAQVDTALVDFLDVASTIETGVTLRQALRAFLSALAGKVSGMDSNAPVFRDVGDSKNRITATTDTNGNRTAVTLDLS